ncbi:hypothetical protein IWW55_001421 [Coemansia sp. RSA 2706]|nr:hypothetical protein IWW55_001421 [Coemansia sp. RSA 2706]
MIYISDTEDAAPKLPGSSTASSIVIVGTGSQSQPNSSGWPSLLNIRSNMSLLSSYTPPEETMDDMDTFIETQDIGSDLESATRK